MKRFFTVFLAIITIVILVASCKGGDKYVSKYVEDYKYDGTSLVGKWQESSYKNEEYQTYEFFQNGDVICTIYSFGIEMGRIEATYKVDGDNTLLITWDGNPYPDRNKFSINKDNYLVICQVVDSSTLEMELVPYDMKYNVGENALIGSWISKENPLESFTFFEGYTGVSRGDGAEYDFHYSIKDSSIFFSFEIIDEIKSPVESMTYKIEENTLTLAGKDKDGKEITLTFEKAE